MQCGLDPSHYVTAVVDLVDIGYRHKLAVCRDFHRRHNIPDELARPMGAPWIVVGSGKRRRRRREHKQKRGRRSGLLLRLRNNPHKPPLPSLYLTNARSITHKKDDLELQLEGNRYIRDCCVLIITETWLKPTIPDASVQLAGRSLHRWDRTEDSGKSRGGGVFIYVHEDWCNNSKIIETHCSPDIEYMSVRCRPYFLPRELTVVIVTAVYIPPDANASTALSLLLNVINEHQRAHPDGVYIIAGDFNKANLKTVLPKFHQHVKCPTRGANTLDHVCSNIKHGYRATPLPHLGQSDHLSLLLTPAYIPLRRRSRPTKKIITTLPENALSELQDCLQHTDWDLFQHQDLETYTVTVLDYIKFCMGTVSVDKVIRIFPNQKPWMTSQVRSLPKACNSAFRSGDRALYREEYFKVMHDRQVKVCRLCIQPGHSLRECPEFKCFSCGAQGHYARECRQSSDPAGDEEMPEARIQAEAVSMEEEEGQRPQNVKITAAARMEDKEQKLKRKRSDGNEESVEELTAGREDETTGEDTVNEMYIEDEVILKKLEEWGVQAVSTIRRRMWPGTDIADGTRYLKVRFNEKVRSLPFATKFETLEGEEHFRVLHDRQRKVCRLCIQPGHIIRDCPEFKCFKCGEQGHYARECEENERGDRGPLPMQAEAVLGGGLTAEAEMLVEGALERDMETPAATVLSGSGDDDDSSNGSCGDSDGGCGDRDGGGGGG
uniref:uncharacterized protein LOC131129485 n=1 Tax=Doryrhamphus excisus TaxID=161450 RepID=UPI0025ADD66D|nr:uncharacterized protein LOC131129485 [Doryrhamphus excisus]